MTHAHARRLALITALALCSTFVAACGSAQRHTTRPRHGLQVKLTAAASAWGAADAIAPGTPGVDAVNGPPASALPVADTSGVVPAGQSFTQRWFSASSPWNTLVTAIPTDPRSHQLISAAMRQVTVLDGRDGQAPRTRLVPDNAGLYINTVAWTDSVVSGGPQTPIHCRQSVCENDGLTQLRIPADVSPDPEYDGWFTVISPDGRTAYDMWRARRLPNGSISYQYMRIWNLDGDGYGRPGQKSARASGLPLLAGLIRPAELSAGAIDHALAISIPAPAAGVYVQPASMTDGDGAATALPEGARIRLKANVALDPKLKLTARQRRYASALMWTLRNYGAIVVGRASVPTLYGQGGVTASLLAGNELQSLKLSDFQVVQMPAEQTNAVSASAAKALAALPKSTAASAGPGTSELSHRATVSTHPASELLIDGSTSDSLTPAAVADYRAAGGTESVSVANRGARAAFAELCSGHADIVDSTVPISSTQEAACAQAGIRPVQLQVASQGLVLATENATDVGADCLTSAQVRATFRAGSPVTNWSQLGFDSVALQLAGLNPAARSLAAFDQSLTGSAGASLLDLRYDYRAQSSQAAVRRFVVASRAVGERASQALPRLGATLTNLGRLLRGARATERGAARAATEAAYQVQKGITDGRSLSAQAADAASEVAAAQKLSAARARLAQLRARLAATHTQISAAHHALAAARRSLGRLGAFSYSYYTLFEDQLRPLEISSTANPENCVYPSQETITSGQYPLSHQLLVTVSLQELRQNQGLRLFLESYLNHATTLAQAAAVVPLPTDLLAAEQAWLTGRSLTASTPTAAADGSSALTSMSVSRGASAPGPAQTSTTPAAGGQSGAADGIPSGVH